MANSANPAKAKDESDLGMKERGKQIWADNLYVAEKWDKVRRFPK